MRQQLKRGLFFVFIFGLTVLVYRNGLEVHYYHDDFLDVFTNPEEQIYKCWVTANDLNHFYRPLASTGTALIQLNWGLHPLPVHIIDIFLHSIVACFVFFVLRRLKVSKICSIIGALFVLVSQLSAFTILSNNCLSQILAALFSGLSLWLLYDYLRSGNTSPEWKYVGSIVCFFFAFLSKETSAGLIIAVPMLIFALEDHHEHLRKRVSQTVVKFLPFAIAVMIYGIMRIHAGALMPATGSTNYAIHFGSNIISNSALYFGQALLSFSSADVVLMAKAGNALPLIGIGAATILSTIIFAFGLWKTKRRNTVLALVFILILSSIPVIFLARPVTESYHYNMIIPLALLIGISVEYFSTIFQNLHLVKRILLGALLIAVISINATAVNKKALMMTRMGDRANTMLAQLIPLSAQVPHNEWMYLASPPDSVINYSKYVMPWLMVLSYSDSLFSFETQRPDIRRFGGTYSECRDSALIHPGITFVLDTGTATIYSAAHKPESSGK